MTDYGFPGISELVFRIAGGLHAETEVERERIGCGYKISLSNAELMEKYDLAHEKLDVVFAKLLEKSVVTREEMSLREKRGPEKRNIIPKPSQGPSIDPALGKAATELLRKGSHDNELMMKFGMSPGQLQTLLSQMVEGATSRQKNSKPGSSAKPRHVAIVRARWLKAIPTANTAERPQMNH